LADIGGRTLVEHVYRHAADARSVDLVVVATDDDRIARAVTAFGGRVRMTRPDHATGTDRLAEVAETLDCDLVVNVQGDEPLIMPEAIDAAVAAAANPAVAVSTLRCPLRDAAAWRDPDVVKVAVDRDGYALFFSRAPIGLDRGASPATSIAVDKHLGLYVYRRPFLLTLSRLEPTPLERAERLEQLRVLEHGYRIMTTRIDDDPIGVDTPADLDRVRRRFAAGAPA
jgi:3-deoxy-manno-octulosonate cytidylyltransferase (CMP-KDO synthetase)